MVHERSSAVKKFDFRFPDFGQTEAVDEIHYFLQRRLDHRLAASHDAEAKDRALPEFLIPAFGYRDVELICDPGLNSFEDPALAF